MSKKLRTALALFMLTLLPAQIIHATSLPMSVDTEPSKAPARAFFVDLKNNDEVAGTFTVKFGIEGMKIAPAGLVKSGTGHFHLLIDTEPFTADFGKKPLPTDMKHLDFAAGQSETNLTLPAGEHTLQLVMGDGAHKLHNPPVISEVIKIKVK